MLTLKLSMLFFMLIVLVDISSAQQKALSGQWQFHSINNAGLLEGETGSAFQVQTVNGLKYKSWFTGLGLGLDLYRVRSIPLFADIRKEFGKENNKLFVYADVGINFSWATDQQKTSYVEADKFSNGFYSDLGLGYKVLVGRRNAVLLSLGYSFKKTVESYDQVYFVPNGLSDPGGSDADKQKINYSLNRLSLKIGWEF
jgi:hypothetical protein